MSIRIKILNKDKNFIDNLFDFLSNNSYEFKRQLKLDNIFESVNKLNDSNDKIGYIKSQSPINIESVYGSTYQSKYRSNEQIYAISHSIHSIEIDNDQIFANINPNEFGEVIDFNKGHLKPVYHKKTVDEKYSLVTFDIDFDINE
jgi:hypothetical protein